MSCLSGKHTKIYKMTHTSQVTQAALLLDSVFVKAQLSQAVLNTLLHFDLQCMSL